MENDFFLKWLAQQCFLWRFAALMKIEKMITEKARVVNSIVKSLSQLFLYITKISGCAAKFFNQTVFLQPWQRSDVYEYDLKMSFSVLPQMLIG